MNKNNNNMFKILNVNKSKLLIMLTCIYSLLSSLNAAAESAILKGTFRTVSLYYIGENYNFSNIEYKDKPIYIRLNDYLVDKDTLPKNRVKSTFENENFYVWIKKSKNNKIVIIH